MGPSRQCANGGQWPEIFHALSDWSNLVLAACAVVGVIGMLVGLGFGYGAFKARQSSALESQRAAVKALHERLDSHKARLERLERIAQQTREVLIREEMMVPTDTQTGIQTLPHRR